MQRRIEAPLSRKTWAASPVAAGKGRVGRSDSKSDGPSESRERDFAANELVSLMAVGLHQNGQFGTENHFRVFDKLTDPHQVLEMIEPACVGGRQGRAGQAKTTGVNNHPPFSACEGYLKWPDDKTLIRYRFRVHRVFG